MNTLNSSLITEKNKLATNSVWLPLVSVWVTTDTILRLVPNPESITFRGITYTPFPMQIDTVKRDSAGGLAEVVVTVSNVTRAVSAYVEANDMRGSKVNVVYANSAYLSDPTAIVLEENFEIVGIKVVGDQTVSFSLGHERILSHLFPASRFLRDNCRWIYLSAECGATNPITQTGTVSSSGLSVTGSGTSFLSTVTSGDTITASSQSRTVNQVVSNTSLTVTVAPSPVWASASFTITKPTCSKMLGGSNGCRSHSNALRFGGFPLVPYVPGRLV